MPPSTSGALRGNPHRKPVAKHRARSLGGSQEGSRVSWQLCVCCTAGQAEARVPRQTRTTPKRIAAIRNRKMFV